MKQLIKLSLLTLKVSLLFVLTESLAFAEDPLQCNSKCDEKCAYVDSSEDPQAICVAADGLLPSVAEVTVDDIAPGGSGWVTLRLQWDYVPMPSHDRALEFSVVIADEDLYIEPFDGEDFDPYNHFQSTLPCDYRDVYNHSPGTVENVLQGLIGYCGYPQSKDTVDFANLLWLGIANASDGAHQFAVGSQCPWNIQPHKPYTLQYKVRRKTGENIKDHGYAWIIQDGVPNYSCPLITGDSLGTFLGSLGFGDPKPPILLNRLCVPTDTYPFVPRSNNTKSEKTVCEDCDNDDLFASQSVPMFGSNVGDSHDSNYDPVLKQCVVCSPGSCSSEEWCQPASGVCSSCDGGCYGIHQSTCESQCGVTTCIPNCTNKCGGASDGCADTCNGCPSAHNCENMTCVSCGGGNEPCCLQGSECYSNLTCQNGVCSSVSVSSIDDLALGVSHTCAVVNGEARCFGSNQDGQLGNGSTNNALTPSAVKGINGNGTLSGVLSITAGTSHTCALMGTGRVVCWGSNSIGQLGNGTTTQSTIPVEVLGPNGNGILSNVAEISAGNYFTCARTNGSIAYCWGKIPFGTVGGAHTEPEQLSTITNALEISAGGEHLCLRKADDSLWCVGDNYYGQLGNGTSSNSSLPSLVQVMNSSNIPASIQGLPKNLGTEHSCAWTAPGTVSCWGNASLSQVSGTGSGTCEAGYACEKKAIVAISSSGGLAVGGNHTCSLKNGAVMCWGSNNNGQVGLNAVNSCSGSNACSYQEVNVEQCVSGSFTASKIAAGGDHSCAVTNSGLMCWGRNANGELGNGTTVNSSCPIAVFGL